MFLIPIAKSTQQNVLLVVLEEENLTRLRAYDPGEVNLTKLPAPWCDKRFDQIQICYIAEADRAQLFALLQSGNVGEAVRMLVRGWTYRPEEGDHDQPYSGKDARTDA